MGLKAWADLLDAGVIPLAGFKLGRAGVELRGLVRAGMVVIVFRDSDRRRRNSESAIVAGRVVDREGNSTRAVELEIELDFDIGKPDVVASDGTMLVGL